MRHQNRYDEIDRKMKRERVNGTHKAETRAHSSCKKKGIEDLFPKEVPNYREWERFWFGTRKKNGLYTGKIINRGGRKIEVLLWGEGLNGKEEILLYREVEE